MHDPNRLIKWLLIIAMVVVSLAVLYPPNEKLKGGIDLVGGTSLLFEIDTTGLEDWQRTDLSERVMSILKERIDPKGQRNLEWMYFKNTPASLLLESSASACLRLFSAVNQS